MSAWRSWPAALLTALVVGSVLLVVVELANGAARPVHPVLADPCKPRPPFAGTGISGVVQRVVLEGLDGAACKLGTTREELVLSLSPSSSRSRRWTPQTISAAVRSGLTTAIDREARQGHIPGFLVPLLHRLVRTVPLDKLVRGGISLGNLIP